MLFCQSGKHVSSELASLMVQLGQSLADGSDLKRVLGLNGLIA